MIKGLNILLVEDDDVAAESITRALKVVVPDVPVINAENGRIALDILNSEKRNETLKSPYIILLDLNMPVMNGFEFLDEVRKSKKLQDSVIFVLTTSNEDSDRTKAYHHNVAGYMVKSAVGPQFSKLANLLKSYKETIELNV
jgi:CheY-like chemotaxis protein